MRLTVARSIMGFGIFLILGLIAGLGVGTFALQELRIGSPRYQKIINSKDLLGDLITPPEFIVEAYVEARLAADDVEELPRHKARLAELYKLFRERHAY